MLKTIAVFDIGKTNKKILLFDLQMQLVHEVQTVFEEVKDDEGESCEDLHALTAWMTETWQTLQNDVRFDITALNFATYGASFVHLDAQGKPVTPLYNYLKNFPADYEKKFYNAYGDKDDIATATASPVLGMLNSGLQLYWLKYAHPLVFKKISTSLHLPQYCAYLFTQKKCSEYTSIGCHTALWDMQQNDYHTWVKAEGIDTLFAPVTQNYTLGYTRYRDHEIPVGTGLHDSSAALIPYFKKNKQPFVLVSTGTWSICLYPFAKSLLTKQELQKDCLNYMTFEGVKVKASRLFLGHFHEVFTKIFAGHFVKDKDYYKNIDFDADTYTKALAMPAILNSSTLPEQVFDATVLDSYTSYEQAYHRLMEDMVTYQYDALLMATDGMSSVEKIFVDGGFNKNKIFMKLLSQKCNGVEVIAHDLSQGTSMGAAMVMLKNE
ncbi:MAG: FGGY family carbohydrate kinase [Cytophagales bacterium]|nr:FGGY family carbohydrate kinase [Cytophagales bacterium]